MIIQYETAILAKEIGFDVITDKAYWFANPMLNNLETKIIDNTLKTNFNFRAFAQNCLAPSICELQKWLRDSHNKDVLMLKPNNNEYVSYIWGETRELQSFKTYEQALEYGIIQALKIIKDGSNRSKLRRGFKEKRLRI